MAAEDIAERFQAAIMPELQRLRRDNKELRAEIERLRRVEEQYKELKAAAWDVEKAFLHNQGSMDRAIDTLSDLLQEGE